MATAEARVNELGAKLTKMMQPANLQNREKQRLGKIKGKTVSDTCRTIPKGPKFMSLESSKEKN